MARRPTSSPTRSRTAPRIISPAAMGEPAPRKDVRMAIVNDHTVKAFDEDLNRLRGLISEMGGRAERSEEHTSELQSLMRNSYAVFCLKKKKQLEINSTALYP